MRLISNLKNLLLCGECWDEVCRECQVSTGEHLPGLGVVGSVENS